MTEPDAEYYQAHKDDPEEWGEPEPRTKPRTRRLAAMISVRFAPHEEEAVRQAAATRGESVSHFIRQAALKEARPDGSSARTVILQAQSLPSTGSTLASAEVIASDSLVQMGKGKILGHPQG